DATGIIVAAAITSLLGLPMGVDAIIEYIAGFAFGLFIFQALFMKDMLGGSYWQAVKSTILPEWLSMNAVMAGMIPVMIILMTRDMRAMEPGNVRFWGIMSLASLAGAVLAFPVNYWLVSKKLKHGMGTERSLGKGGAKTETDGSKKIANQKGTTSAAHNMSAMGEKKMDGMNMGGNVPASSKLVVTLITLAMLAGGGFLAARYGNLSMRAGDMEMKQTPMDNMQMNDMKNR
ncbi:MAG: DUF4396 domain-containing protein, partial [Pyrinomonadaceae bacterium]